jgi:hypothetical protein
VALRLGGGIAGFHLLPCLGLTTLPYQNPTRKLKKVCHRNLTNETWCQSNKLQ